MSEESVLILNMLREGTITAEQADSLLRAVRETAAPAPPAAPTPPAAPPVSDPATLAAMQNKLGELQGKLGEIQSKLGAAQAAKAAGQAASLAGKVLDHIPRPEIHMGQINKTVGDALRDLNSYTREAARSAKVTARRVGQEARRAARQGRKSMKFDFHIGSESEAARPRNHEAQPQANEVYHSTLTWSGADRLHLSNTYGGIKVVGSDDQQSAAEASVVKTAWAASEGEARVVLQQVFLTSRVEGGVCRIEVIAPSDARDRLTVDYELQVPRQIALQIETTHGEIHTEGVSARVSARSESGRIHGRQPAADGGGDTRFHNHSGEVLLENWHAPGSTLLVETTSGDVQLRNVETESAVVTSRSGDVDVSDLASADVTTLESTSGDVSVAGGSAGKRLSVKTQSGNAEVGRARAEQVAVETISGDAQVREAGGVLTVKTVSGSIEVEGLQSPAVSLGTISGDGHVAFAAPFSGSLAGTTVSGDLVVTLWTSSDARIDLHTTSGKLSCALPLEDQPADIGERRLSGKIGSGTGVVKLQSVSGDLEIRAQS